VWQQVFLVDVRALLEQPRVVIQARTAVLDVVDHPPLATAGDLRAPYRCRVVYPKIPSGPDFKSRIMRDVRDTAVALRFIEEFAVIAPRVGRIERTAEFLIKFLVAHLQTQTGDRGVGQRSRLCIIKQIRRIPFRYARSVISGLQQPAAFRCAAANKRAVPVGQHRLNHQRHHRLRRVVELVDDAFVGIATAPGVRVIGTASLPRSTVRQAYRHL